MDSSSVPPELRELKKLLEGALPPTPAAQPQPCPTSFVSDAPQHALINGSNIGSPRRCSSTPPYCNCSHLHYALTGFSQCFWSPARLSPCTDDGTDEMTDTAGRDGWTVACNLPSVHSVHCRVRAEALGRCLSSRLGPYRGQGLNAVLETTFLGHNNSEEDTYGAIVHINQNTDSSFQLLNNTSHVITSEPGLQLSLIRHSPFPMPNFDTGLKAIIVNPIQEIEGLCEELDGDLDDEVLNVVVEEGFGKTCSLLSIENGSQEIGANSYEIQEVKQMGEVSEFTINEFYSKENCSLIYAKDKNDKNERMEGLTNNITNKTILKCTTMTDENPLAIKFRESLLISKNQQGSSVVSSQLTDDSLSCQVRARCQAPDTDSSPVNKQCLVLTRDTVKYVNSDQLSHVANTELTTCVSSPIISSKGCDSSSQDVNSYKILNINGNCVKDKSSKYNSRVNNCTDKASISKSNFNSSNNFIENNHCDLDVTSGEFKHFSIDLDEATGCTKSSNLDDFPERTSSLENNISDTTKSSIDSKDDPFDKFDEILNACSSDDNEKEKWEEEICKEICNEAIVDSIKYSLISHNESVKDVEIYDNETKTNYKFQQNIERTLPTSQTRKSRARRRYHRQNSFDDISVDDTGHFYEDINGIAIIGKKNKSKSRNRIGSEGESTSSGSSSNLASSGPDDTVTEGSCISEHSSSSNKSSAMNGRRFCGGRTTPPLPPNTLPPPSRCTSTHTVAPVRYPPPPTDPKYYEGLPQPDEMVASPKGKGKEKAFCDQLTVELKKLSVAKKKVDREIFKEELQEELSKLERCKKKLEDEVFNTSVEEKLIKQYSEREIVLEEHTKRELIRAKSMAACSSGTETPEAKPPFKRSSSLKYTKTPPDQKHLSKKKRVKFADVFGMDLVDVRTFLAGIPTVPQSAFSDLHVELPQKATKRDLRYFFKNPCLETWFWDRIFEQKVLLERVYVGEDLSVKGVIRVQNLSFNKSLIVRYTFDQWKNYHETSATYLAGSTDGRSDQFHFLLWGNFLQEKGTLIFCIKYQTLGKEFWDNNFGNNYKLQCYTITLSPTQPSNDDDMSPMKPEATLFTPPSRHQDQSLEASPEQDAQAESLYKSYKQFDSGAPSPTDQWTHKFI